MWPFWLIASLAMCVKRKTTNYALFFLGEINQADERGEWESEGMEADQGKRIESVETKGQKGTVPYCQNGKVG